MGHLKTYDGVRGGGGGVSFKRNFNAALVGEYNRVILIVLSTEVIM